MICSQKSGENDSGVGGGGGDGRNNPQAALPLINSTMVFLSGDEVASGGSSARAQLASAFATWLVAAVGLTWRLLSLDGAH